MIGPSIPAHLLSKGDNQEQEQQQQREEDPTPVLPEDEDDLADAFMPELPPDLLEPAPTPTTTTTTAASKRRTMGPQLPSAEAVAAAATTTTTSHYHDDDDDTIGPALPSQYDVDQAALHSTVAAIEERAKQSEQAMSKEQSGDKKVERPEWMLAPPDVDYLKNANNGRTRTFNQRTVDAAKRDTSSWTDTPADKASKQHNTPSSSSKQRPDQRPTQAEMELRRKVDDHNKTERSMSLLELHRMNNQSKIKKRKAEEDPSKRPFDREKDLMGTRPMNKKQKAELLEKSGEWSDRFSSTRGSSFL
ncbi:hypothetical protein [Absidia glauca]|uniref:DUF3752 domain-containing protein n=1 Tax=Absidia glauca TaxID=4829 RepID=A0A168QST1_ABSGL|nr:hypothetical protein [Absidia glauca]